MHLITSGEINNEINLKVIPIAGSIIGFGYLMAALVVLIRAGGNLSDTFSNLHHTSLAWLRFLVLGASVLWMMNLGSHVAAINHNLGLYGMMDIVRGFYFFIFINLAMARGFRQPEVFRQTNNPKTRVLSGKHSSPGKLEEEPVSEEVIEPLLDELKVFMTNSQPYLNPNLTIGRLAGEFGHSTRLVRKAIQSSGNNFCDFVNEYRIDQSKMLLKASDLNQPRIQDVMIDSGFNSKSVFNTAFKKYTGMTPSTYRLGGK
ncbi:MAG: helix-turn-helix transcriptional regulator [bacterium]|nr:helix-turn-helix transcriptional regulator [bacterium]